MYFQKRWYTWNKILVPLFKILGLIAIVGNIESYLGTSADLCLNTYVKQEACPNNLAPTSSSTAQLAMGDALAVCLLEMKKDSPVRIFAKYHPGGALGKKLYLKTKDIFPHNESPRVFADDDLKKKVIVEISSKRLGAAAVLQKNKLVGIITDGDLRRMLLTGVRIDNMKAKDIMSVNPRLPTRIWWQWMLNLMKTHNISQLIITDKGKYAGMVHFAWSRERRHSIRLWNMAISSC